MATDYEGGLPAPMVDELKEPAMTPDELAKVAKGLTVAQREKLERLGGAAWLRDRIDKAKEPA